MLHLGIYLHMNRATAVPLVSLKVVNRHIHSSSLLQLCDSLQQYVVVVRVW